MFIKIVGFKQDYFIKPRIIASLND